MKLWRDLEAGEEIKVGDRFYSERQHKWKAIKANHLKVSNRVGNMSWTHQRLVISDYKE